MSLLKNIFLAVLIIGIIGSIIFGYLHFSKIKQPSSSLYQAIPSSAAMIVVFDDALDVWSKLSETNIIWEELQVTELFADLNSKLAKLKLLYDTNDEIKKVIDNNELIISAHMTGAEKFNFLFCVKVPPTIPQQKIEVFSKKISVSNKKFKTVDIFTTAEKENDKFSFAVYQNTFVGSYSIELIESAINQLTSDLSANLSPSFSKVKTTAGSKMDANIYVNNKIFPTVIATFLQEEYKSLLNDFSITEDWTELDMKIKPNAVSLNGFTNSVDTGLSYLNVFKNQSPQNIGILDVIPYNTASLVQLSLSDFDQYQQDLKAFFKERGELNAYSRQIQYINKLYDVDVEHSLFNWVKNEIAIISTEPTSNNMDRDVYLLLESKDTVVSTNSLNRLVQQVNKVTKIKTDSNTYRDYTIQQINIPDLFPSLFGSLFSKVKYNYFTHIDDYVLVGNSYNALRDFITDYLAEKTLKKDLHFSSFSDNVAGKSNIFIYSNIARSPMIYSSFLNEKNTKDVEHHVELFRKFEAITWQITADEKDLFYNNIYIKHNPIYKQETTSLWETILDSTINMKPFLHKNHYTGAKEIFVQDEANNIYLINNKGKVLWKRNLPEKIKGTPVQIDAFKNAKLQLLFNTTTTLYLIDRNGKNVENFPISLTDSASTGLSVMDYDKSRDYRILVPLKNGKVANYDRGGKLVKGWNQSFSKAAIISDFQHFSLKRKDYIVTQNDKGEVFAINRKGEVRIRLKNKLPVNAKSTLNLEIGKTIGKSYVNTTDSTGKIYRLSFDDKLTIDSVTTFSGNPYFLFEDINYDQFRDYIYVDGQELSVYNQNKSKILEYRFDTTIVEAPLVFKFADGAEIGIVSPVNNEIYLINELGIPRDGLPLHGTTPFSIGDINRDGTYNIIVGGKRRTVYSYNLED